MNEPGILTIGLAKQSYDIVIGSRIIEEAGRRLKALGDGQRLFLVHDANTALDDAVYRTTEALEGAGLKVEAFPVPPGEASKSLESYGRLMESLLRRQPDRRTTVAALGGGVVGDLAGFAAASMLRGVPFLQLPTTLLAQVDSAVGGKTGINSAHGKNLIGAFHQPCLVLCDLDLLATLPPREMRSGYAEVVKYGLLGDAAFFGWLEERGHSVLDREPKSLTRAVKTSLEAKAKIVAEDEEERTGRRALLNLGHTFAHAFERLTGYTNRLLHGEAVAIGMVRAFELSEALGLSPADDTRRVRHHLQSVGLPIQNQAPDWSPEAVIDAMAGDKKAIGARLTFVLVRGIGQAFTTDQVDQAVLHQVLARAQGEAAHG
ncbi:MAG: 3-dehydroquinate synthase [Geminicoccaceae bacterium]